MTDFVHDDTDLPEAKVNRKAATDPTRQWSAEDANAVFQALRDIQTYLRDGVFDVGPVTMDAATVDTATIDTAAIDTAAIDVATITGATIAGATITHADMVADASPSIGPELDYKGFRARWFMGVDVANSPTSRDFVHLGVRGSYSISDGVTVNGSPTLTSASEGNFVTALVGAVVSGTGIPVGTTITGVGGLTSLTMSANATATATGLRVTFTRSSVQDIMYWKHRGALSPTCGIGVTPPDGSARLQVSPQDDEPTMGTIRLRCGSSQTGKILTIHDSSPTDRLWVDKDFYLTGNHPTTSGAIAISADATNQHALTITDSTKTNFYSFDLPAASGGVMRFRCQSGGVSSYEVGTDGSFRHLSTKVGFFGASTATKPTVTGSRAGNAALASLLTALAGLGLLTDSSTA